MKHKIINQTIQKAITAPALAGLAAVNAQVILPELDFVSRVAAVPSK
ncbi:MAG TPA: hypothetical protein VMH87_17895 [Pseudomonadales bacterium]|nr:hypothetical protein [Pseudomonadales bacterium]